VIPLDNQDIISAPEGIAEGDILPPVEEHAEIADKDASPAERPTLLVVDDNTDFREFMKLSLSGVYSVLTAADGEDAWKLIPEELPDMVISDVMMPYHRRYHFMPPDQGRHPDFPHPGDPTDGKVR